jgi:hypothetical protein
MTCLLLWTIVTQLYEMPTLVDLQTLSLDMASELRTTFDQQLREIVVVVFLIGLPFILTLPQLFRLPQGYQGIRNEQLSHKDQRDFDIWKFSSYELVVEEDIYDGRNCD